MNYRKGRGFTLIELVIVIVIVGVLTVCAIPIFRTYVRRSMSAEGKSLINRIVSAERIYYTENHTQCLIGSMAAPVGNDVTLNIDVRANKYFNTFCVTGLPGVYYDAYSFGTGDASGLLADVRGVAGLNSSVGSREISDSNPSGPPTILETW